MPGALSAEEYITTHWERRRVWRHLDMRKHRARLRRCAQLMEGDTFADVGCAMGHSTVMMARRRSGQWIGIDFSETAVNQARAEFGANFRYYPTIGDLFDSPRYDGVVCSEVIEHVPDDELLAQALRCMTRRILVVTTPSIQMGDPGHLRLYTKQGLRALFGPNAVVDQQDPFWFVKWRPT